MHYDPDTLNRLEAAYKARSGASQKGRRFRRRSICTTVFFAPAAMETRHLSWKKRWKDTACELALVTVESITNFEIKKP
jgi:hypothetical protein